MYKVFYNQRTVFFIEAENTSIEKDKSRIHFFKSKESLMNDLIVFLNTQDLNKFYVINNDVDFAFKEYAENFKIIEASGGLVKNKENEILMIFRREIWDLPKGKIEKNELPKDTAIREVEEECGITNLEIGTLINITYHNYEFKGKKILKRTFWFEMFYNGNKNPKPQIEEEITEVKWIRPDNLKEFLNNTFPSIIEVFRKGNIVSSE